MTTFVINCNANKRYAIEAMNVHEAFRLAKDAGYTFEKIGIQVAKKVGSECIWITPVSKGFGENELLSVIEGWKTVDVELKKLESHVYNTKGVLPKVTGSLLKTLELEGWIRIYTVNENKFVQLN